MYRDFPFIPLAQICIDSPTTPPCPRLVRLWPLMKLHWHVIITHGLCFILGFAPTVVLPVGLSRYVYPQCAWSKLEAGVRVRERFEAVRLLALKTEVGWGDRSQKCRWLLEAGRHQEMIFPQGLQKEHSFALILAHWGSYQDFWSQKQKRAKIDVGNRFMVICYCCNRNWLLREV